MSSEDGNVTGVPSPWNLFLAELDARLPEAITLHCIGGFVVSVLYGLPRPTGDVDYVSAIPYHRIQELEVLAGRGSELEKKFKVHLQHVTVATMPEDYEARLVEMFAGRFENLRIFAPDPYDLVLTKLERNSPKDQGDVEYLAKTLLLDAQVLRDRYQRGAAPESHGTRDVA
jgi:Nucleotidyltransferase of unknown function (DUF6036)